jgi:hypothetical protein
MTSYSGVTPTGYTYIGSIIINNAENIAYNIEVYNDNHNNANRYILNGNALFAASSSLPYYTIAIKATPVSSNTVDVTNIHYGGPIYGTVSYATPSYK